MFAFLWLQGSEHAHTGNIFWPGGHHLPMKHLLAVSLLRPAILGWAILLSKAVKVISQAASNKTITSGYQFIVHKVIAFIVIAALLNC